MPAQKKAPQFRRSPPGLIDAFDAALPPDSRIERRPMFGYPCAFTGGRLFTGLHGADIMVRLGEEDRAKLLAMPGARTFEPMAGRPMREYILVPPGFHADAHTLRAWMLRALEFTASLPPKKPSRAARTAGGKSGGKKRRSS